MNAFHTKCINKMSRIPRNANGKPKICPIYQPNESNSRNCLVPLIIIFLFVQRLFTIGIGIFLGCCCCCFPLHLANLSMVTTSIAILNIILSTQSELLVELILGRIALAISAFTSIFITQIQTDSILVRFSISNYCLYSTVLCDSCYLALQTTSANPSSIFRQCLPK